MGLYVGLPHLKEGHIRLLQIEPASDASHIVKCRLDVIPLSEAPSFIALSYTWGPPHAGYGKGHEKELKADRKRSEEQQLGPHSNGGSLGDVTENSIICNGFEILVGRNLYDFLLRVSESEDQNLRGPLWVDAISINQSDDPERSHQVNLMAEIYKAASGVLVWLGSADDSTSFAFELIESLALLSPTERLQLYPHNILTQSTDIVLNLDHWKALARFFEHTWFNRAWIIQEVTFARQITVLCGPHTVPWDYLPTVSGFLATSSWTQFFKQPGIMACTSNASARWHNTPARLAATQRTWSSGSRDGLLYALIRARPSACQDPRDKVYSQLALGNANIFPSYKISVAEAYVNAAKYILEHSDNLLLLTCVEGEEFQKIPGLPSWVPDWSVSEFVGLRVTGYGSYTASSDRARKYQLKLEKGKHILSVEATMVDDIVEIGETKRELRYFSKPERFWNMVSNLDEVYITKQSREEVIWRTLMTNRQSGLVPAILYPSSKELEPSFRDWIIWRYVVATQPPRRYQPTVFPPVTHSSTILPPKEEILETIEKCQNSLADFKALGHRAALFDVHYAHAMLQRPFRTKQGFFGLGTQALREADSVWIVSGCRVPIILRKIEDSPRYRLVGGSYVHGFMDGEVVTRKDVEFQMVELE